MPTLKGATASGQTMPFSSWLASIKAPTPSGPIMLKVPPGSFNGRELRIKGRGLPSKEPGDLFAVLQIVLPAADTEAAKEAYREMERKLAFDPRAKLGV